MKSTPFLPSGGRVTVIVRFTSEIDGEYTHRVQIGTVMGAASTNADGSPLAGAQGLSDWLSVEIVRVLEGLLPPDRDLVVREIVALAGAGLRLR